MRTLLFAVALFPASVYASHPCSEEMHPLVDKYENLSCREKSIATEWIEMAMRTPAEKADRRIEWNAFLTAHPEAATDIISDFINSSDYDGAGNYEKWGILRDLPTAVRETIIKRSFDGFVRGDNAQFYSFLNCWGALLLETQGFYDIVSRLDSFEYYERYNTELLKTAIRHNYAMGLEMEGFTARLMEAYKEDYSDFQDWYDPEFTFKELSKFKDKLLRKQQLKMEDVPLVIIP